jgi:hypothetical protein
MPDYTKEEIAYADLLDLLEARASRLKKAHNERSGNDSRPLYQPQNADRVNYVDDLSAFGIKTL